MTVHIFLLHIAPPNQFEKQITMEDWIKLYVTLIPFFFYVWWYKAANYIIVISDGFSRKQSCSRFLKKTDEWEDI